MYKSEKQARFEAQSADLRDASHMGVVLQQGVRIISRGPTRCLATRTSSCHCLHSCGFCADGRGGVCL